MSTTMLPPPGEIADIAHDALHRNDDDVSRWQFLASESRASAGTGIAPSAYSTAPPKAGE